MRALDEFLDTYESEHGEITEQEMQAATRRARARAVVVRASAPEQEGEPESPTRQVG